MSDETQYEPDHPDPRYAETTTARQKERYTETITAGEDGATDTPSPNDSGTVIDPDGNVQAPLEDDGA